MTKREERLFGADDSVYRDSIEKGLYSEERKLDDNLENTWQEKLDDKTICSIHSSCANNIVRKDGSFDNFVKTVRQIVSEKDVSTQELKQYWNKAVDMLLKPGNNKKIEESNDEQEYEYMLLDRLRSDCDYYLGSGNRQDKFLWAGNVDGQIAKMRELYHKLKVKPDWISMKDIDNYAKKMKANELPSTTNGTAKKEIDNMLNRGYEKKTRLGLEETKLTEDRLNFKKYGIERAPELDFSDDGNRFRMYRCNGIPISYLKDDGNVFLAIRVDYLDGLTYNEYSKLPSYKDCDKYNYVAEDKVDLADVVEICKRVKAEYDNALKNVKDVSDDDYKAYTDKYLEKAKREFEEAKQSIKSLEPEDLLNTSEWDIKVMKEDLQHIKNEIDTWSWERKSKTDQISRRRNLGYDSEENFKKVSYWLKDLKERVDKIKNIKQESLQENKEQDIRTIMEIVNESKVTESNYEFNDLMSWVNDLKDLDSDEAKLVVLDKTNNEELAEDVAETIIKMKAGE